jgi:hypothetical protein
MKSAHLLLAALCVLLCATTVHGQDQKEKPRTQWFQQAKWGVFMHYMMVIPTI